MAIRGLSLLAALAIGCGGGYPRGPAPQGPQARGSAPMMKGGIAAAALPYQILDGRTGRQIDEAEVWPRLAKARAVCIGEEHPNPHHHWVQLHAVQQIAKLVGPERLALGLEMVQRPFQGVLDDYSAKRIDAAALQSRVGWEERWGYDFALYGPTLDAAIAAGGSVLALNVPQELRKKISKQGLDSLTPDERAQVPELKLDDAQHRAWWDALMASMGDGAHGSPHAKPAEGAAAQPGPKLPSMEDIYRIQVLWDETMADTSVKWLVANPRGHLIILAGNGHCHDSAIVNRMKRRGIADVVSVRPVIDKDGEVASVLAKPQHDFVVVLQRSAGSASATTEP